MHTIADSFMKRYHYSLSTQSKTSSSNTLRESLRKSRDWVGYTRRLTSKLSQALSATHRACDKFRDENSGYFYDCPQYIHLLSSLQNTFRKLDDLRNTLGDLANRCDYFAKEVKALEDLTFTLVQLADSSLLTAGVSNGRGRQ